MSVDQIIQRFAAHEAEFKTERNNFTYTQTFLIETIDADGNPDGEYRMTSDIIFRADRDRIDGVELIQFGGRRELLNKTRYGS